MKKSLIGIIAFLLMGSNGFSQSEKDFNSREVKLNFLNTILMGSIELGYEQFLSHDQSLGFEFHFNDRFGYNSQKGSRNFDASSIMAYYNFYFDDSDTGRIFVYPFFKYRFGEFTETVDGTLVRTDLNSGFLGLGAGYKWVFKDKFTMGPYANIARGFSTEVKNRFSAVEFKAGFSVGYRF